MSLQDELDKAKEIANKASAAADPVVDSLLQRVIGSKHTVVILAVVVIALIAFSYWWIV